MHAGSCIPVHARMQAAAVAAACMHAGSCAPVHARMLALAAIDLQCVRAHGGVRTVNYAGSI
jgi:hypothetical protein